MKTPDQKPNLPKNKQEAEKNLKQQPKTPRNTIDNILAGIGAIKALGSKFEKQKPTINTSESNELKEKLDNQQKVYDAEILIKRNELYGVLSTPQVYDQRKEELKKLESAKLAHGKYYNETLIPNTQLEERETFEAQNPKESLKILKSDNAKNVEDLKLKFRNAKTQEEKVNIVKAITQGESELIIKTKELIQKNKDLNIKKQKEADDKIKLAFEKSMEDNKKEEELKKISKLQKQGEKVTKKASDKKAFDDKVKFTTDKISSTYKAKVDSLIEKKEDLSKTANKVKTDMVEFATKIKNQRASDSELKSMLVESEIERQDKIYLEKTNNKRSTKEAENNQKKEAKKDHISVYYKIKGLVKDGVESVKKNIEHNEKARNPNGKKEFNAGELFAKFNINQKNTEQGEKAEDQFKKLNKEYEDKKKKLISKADKIDPFKYPEKAKKLNQDLKNLKDKYISSTEQLINNKEDK